MINVVDVSSAEQVTSLKKAIELRFTVHDLDIEQLLLILKDGMANSDGTIAGLLDELPPFIAKHLRCEHTPRLIVCEDDRALCLSCYEEQLDENDLRTWGALDIEEGECASCGAIRL